MAVIIISCAHSHSTFREAGLIHLFFIIERMYKSRFAEHVRELNHQSSQLRRFAACSGFRMDVPLRGTVVRIVRQTAACCCSDCSPYFYLLLLRLFVKRQSIIFPAACQTAIYQISGYSLNIQSVTVLSSHGRYFNLNECE